MKIKLATMSGVKSYEAWNSGLQSGVCARQSSGVKEENIKISIVHEALIYTHILVYVNKYTYNKGAYSKILPMGCGIKNIWRPLA